MEDKNVRIDSPCCIGFRLSFGVFSPKSPPVSAALQKQVTRDFGPLWDTQATVDAFDSLESVPVDYWPVILRDDINEPGAAGFHTDDQGQPFSWFKSTPAGHLPPAMKPSKCWQILRQ